MSIIETLRRAEKDDKVQAILVRLPEGGMAPATPTSCAWRSSTSARPASRSTPNQGLYPSGMVTSTYMLGAASSEFWMQPASASRRSAFRRRRCSSSASSTNTASRPSTSNALVQERGEPYLYDYLLAGSTLSWMSSVYPRL